jgi:DNA polymerase III epsilon subunit-like protein
MDYDLVFDTETNGAVKTDGSLDMFNQRVVQLAWILSYSDGTEIKKNHIISGATTIHCRVPHNITMRDIRTHGKDFSIVVDDFASDVMGAKRIIGHNVDFDIRMVTKEMIRRNIPSDKLIKDMYSKKVDTMHIHTDVCKIPKKYGKKGYKWPKLEEVYKHYFNEFPTGTLHDALYDCEVTLSCYREYKNLKT